MRLFSLAAVALALFSLAPTTTDAQTVIPWMTVDAVNVSVNFGEGSIIVTGVADGEAAPSGRTYSPNRTTTNEAIVRWGLETCHRSLLLALARPGQYHARIGPNTCVVALIAP